MVLSGWLLSSAAIGCSGAPATEEGTAFATDGPLSREALCAQTGGDLEAPGAGAGCGTQASGEACIWSPMAVDKGAQPAEASCDGRDCACVTRGNIHEACTATPSCDCGPSGLFAEAQGCMDTAALEASFAAGTAADLAASEGIYVMVRPGAIDEVLHYDGIDEVLSAHPWIADGLAQSCALERGRPAHDCDLGFGETSGCFLSATDDAGLSARMSALVEYGGRDYSDELIARAAADEAQVVATVIVTEPGLALHFARDAEGFRLVVIDASRFDCGA
ncbi:MAG: hypothetical protein R3B72_40265 [Polyangiaceae bacterium]